jgi:hypothetical protein
VNAALILLLLDPGDDAVAVTYDQLDGIVILCGVYRAETKSAPALHGYTQHGQ